MTKAVHWIQLTSIKGSLNFSRAFDDPSRVGHEPIRYKGSFKLNESELEKEIVRILIFWNGVICRK